MKLILFYNRFVYYYIRILAILLPHPVFNDENREKSISSVLPSTHAKYTTFGDSSFWSWYNWYRYLMFIDICVCWIMSFKCTAMKCFKQDLKMGNILFGKVLTRIVKHPLLREKTELYVIGFLSSLLVNLVTTPSLTYYQKLVTDSKLYKALIFDYY